MKTFDKETPVFDKERVFQPKTVVHCEAEDQAINFCNWLHSIGKRWFDGDSYRSLTAWRSHGEHTCYNAWLGMCGSVDSYNNTGYTILKYNDVLIKEDYTIRYEMIKPISGKTIIEAGACKTQVEAFCEKFKVFKEIEWNAENEKWITENLRDGISWGVSNGFLKEKEKAFDEDKFHFFKDDDGALRQLLSVSGRQYVWGTLSSPTSDHLLSPLYSSFSAAVKRVVTKEHKIKSFDSFKEAMAHFFPVETPKETHLSMMKEFIRLSKFVAPSLKLRCRDHGINSECGAVSCHECPFNQ